MAIDFFRKFKVTVAPETSQILCACLPRPRGRQKKLRNNTMTRSGARKKTGGMKQWPTLRETRGMARSTTRTRKSASMRIRGKRVRLRKIKKSQVQSQQLIHLLGLKTWSWTR